MNDCISTKARHDKRLNPIAKLLFCELKTLCGNDEYTDVSNAYLAECLDVSIRNIKKMIGELEYFSYIKVVILRENDGKSTRKIYIKSF